MAELSAVGAIAHGVATSVVVGTSASPYAKGNIGRDSVGNEYVWCDFTSTVSPEQPVIIASDFTAGEMGITARGAIGVAQAVGTSNDSGWVQVYGRALVQLGLSGVSPSDAANGPTTDEGTSQTVFVLGTSLTSPNGVGWVTGVLTSNTNFIIDGMFVAHDASPGDVSAVTQTSAANVAKHTGNRIAVWLNWPVVRVQDAQVSTS